MAKWTGIGLFCLAWVAVGAFLLPRGSHSTGTPSTIPPATEPGEQIASASPVDPALDTKVREPALPVQDENLVLARPKYEAPVVAPPSSAGRALDLAGAVDQGLDRALAEAKVPPSPLADDAEFLRRVYLDLTGRIPTYDQAVAFLNSKDPYKRSKLIDDLLASSNYGRHLAEVWCDLIVKHDFDNNKNLKTEAFVNWLADEFNRNEHWDKVVAALLTAGGSEEDSPATFFFLANQDNNQPAPDKLVGATGNLFMGIRVQCAECHVHPFNSKWSPTDFWGMAAFFGHTRAEREGMGKKAKNNGPATIAEVDQAPKMPLKMKGKQKAPPVPGGATIAIPDPRDPQKTLRTVSAKFFEGGQPPFQNKGPYRPALAAWVASGQDRYFAPALVNRMWAQLFARGFVNEIDDMMEANPPSNPAVLNLLAGEFTRSGYDLKYLVRVICNTRAYQRTSRPLPENESDDTLFSRMPVKVLSAQMLLDSLATATNYTPSKEELKGKERPKNNKKGGGEAGLVRFFDTQEYDGDPMEYSSGVPQVLRLMNSKLTNAGAEVVSRLAKAGGKRDVIADLYLIVLSRRPSAAEVNGMSAYVDKQADVNKGYAGVFWALLNSAEFACNR